MRNSANPSRGANRGVHSILLAIALVALAVIIWKLSEVFTVAFGGVVGAAMLRGIAIPISRHSRLSEKWSLTLVIAVLFVAAGLICWLFGNQVGDQAGQMEKLIPQAMQKLSDSLNQSSAGQAMVRMTKDVLGDSKTLSGIGLAAGSLMFGIADVVLVIFLSIYFALAPLEYIDGALRLLPVKQRPRVKRALFEAGDALRRWLLAQVVAMVVIGLLVGVILSIMHLPLALLLGGLAGVLEFIPVVGAVLFTIPGVLIAFTQDPRTALYILLAYVGIQQLESNLIIPLLQRWAVRLPPALTLLSVVIGGILLGAPGLVFASPLAVVVVTLVKALYVEDTLEQGEAPA